MLNVFFLAEICKLTHILPLNSEQTAEENTTETSRPKYRSRIYSP